MPEIPIANGFYVSDSLPISHQECINFVPIAQQQAALSQRQLIGTAGIRVIADSGGGSDDINRGSHVMAGMPYFVQGSDLYRLDRGFVAGVETFTLDKLTVAPYVTSISGSGRVSMADNGTQLMILVPGGNGYIYTVAGGLVQITDVDFTANGNPQYVVFIDGYFACSTDSKKWIVSNLNDGTSWDALDFSTAEADPDPIVAPITHNNQIYLTGSETTEGYVNIGGAGFPFQRNNVFLDKGCYAPFSLISTNQAFFMIGGGTNERPGIWQFSGGGFTKISTIVIDEAINDYSDNVLEAAFSISWASKGQYYVAFIFTDRAFIYNMSTGLWHEQRSGIVIDGILEQVRWRVNSLVTAYGYSIVGDSQDGRIGILDESTYQEYDTDIIRIFSSPPIFNGGKSFRLPEIELTMESGIGNGVSEPMVSMDISKDAKTWGYERSRKIGRIGEFKKRQIWYKNGRMPRFCVLRFRISDAIKAAVIRLDVRFA